MRTFLFLLVTVIANATYGLQLANGEPLRAGSATSNITPPLGSDVVGGFVPFPATHIHDELHARCVVLDDGKTKLALVVCDLLGLHRIVSDEARRLIQEQVGIPRENVLISCTHTHSAASALGKYRMRVSQTLDDYQTFVARRIADGVRCAMNSARPAEVAYGTASAPEHVFNRRWFMRPGTMPEDPFGGTDLVKMNPPGGSPNLVEPAGPTDPIVSFISIREPNGKPISVFTSYSLHYVGGVGNGHISADYFGVYSEQLRRLLNADQQDPPFVAMLANGTSGDINNNNFLHPRGRRQPYEQMRYVANDVATKVFAAMQKVEYRSDITLDARYREPIISWRRPTAEELAWAKKRLAEHPIVPGKADISSIYADRTMQLNEYPESSPLPVQVLRIGDIGIGTMPCEVFCEIGLEFKAKSPIKNSFLVSLNHGYYGYLPTPKQHELGGYETWIGTNRVERNASEKMMAELLKMAAEMK